MIDRTARIECDEFSMGEGTIIRAGAQIYGRKVVLGRECFIDEGAVIGGGSAGDLVAGDWLHMGMFSQINTARPVTIGDEVGVGIGTRVFTHGAYLSEFDGYPCRFDRVRIGSRVWLPNAIVLPGVTIGDDVVVAAGSVVTDYLPSGCLAGGTPAKVLKPNEYPHRPPPDYRQAILVNICREAGVPAVFDDDSVRCGDTEFNVAGRWITGPVTDETERLRNQLRSHGIRFRFSPVHGHYEAWT